MTPEQKDTQLDVIAKINEIKSYLTAKEGFYRDQWMRNIYVTFLTVEGAIKFDDINELGLLCVEFCAKKERDTIESN